MTLLALLIDCLTWFWSPADDKWHRTRVSAAIDKYTISSGPPIVWLSRFSWELLQTILAYFIAHALAHTKQVRRITHFEGSLVLGAKFTGGAFSMGSYIFMGQEGTGDWRDHLFVHEFGHSLQSRLIGPFFLFLVAIPSLLSFLLDRWKFLGVHNLRWYETWANRAGSHHIDNVFGSGAIGYEANKNGFFDYNAFWREGLKSLYLNPRNATNNWFGHEPTTRWHWTDALLTLLGLALPAVVLINSIS